MRERIEELNRETLELKDVIRGICLAEDREAAVEAARMLLVTEFDNVQEVAQLLRSPESLPNFATPGLQRGDMELQSLQDRNNSMPLPHDFSLPPDGFQLPVSYPAVMYQQGYLPFQMANGNYVPRAAPSNSSTGGYWTSSMDSPFPAQDLDIPSWLPPLPEG